MDMTLASAAAPQYFKPLKVQDIKSKDGHSHD